MSNQETKVTVILPVYNGEKYLSRAISSILEQSIGIEAINIYIINDGSTDDSEAIIKQFHKNFQIKLTISYKLIKVLHFLVI